MLVISAWLIFHASRRELLHGDTSCSGVTTRYSRWLQLGTGRSVPGSERFKLLWLCSNPFLNPLLKFSDNVLMAQSSNLPRNTLPYPVLSGWAHSFEICLFSVSKPDVWVLGESKNFWFFFPHKGHSGGTLQAGSTDSVKVTGSLGFGPWGPTLGC